MEQLDSTIRILGVIPFIVAPFFVYKWFKMMWVMFKNRNDLKKKPNFIKIFPFKSTALFALPIFAVFILSANLEQKTRIMVKEFLNNTPPNVAVFINGNPSLDSKKS